MSDPQKYTRDYSFTDYQASNPSAPLPGLRVDAELEDVEASIGEIVDAIKDVRRSDGALKNGIVTVDSLSPTVAAGVGSGALASAAAAAASADAASDSAVAAAASATAASGSATSASGYASDALTSRNEASGFSDDSAAAASLAQTARDYANQWATEAEDTLVDDGVNTPGYSAYHWAQVALDAAAGSIADGSVTTPKLADGALSADTTGRAKMADGFVNSAKILDANVTTAKLATGVLSADTTGRAKMADGFVTSAKIADGFLSADTTGRAKMADGFLTRAKLDATTGGKVDVISGRNLIVNGQGRVNQRQYVSGTATTVANQVTLDRWRVVVSGQSLTFTGDESRRVMTAPAGGVDEVIEAGDVVDGTYVLNWTGAAAATVNGTARTKGEAFTLAANTAVTIRFIGGTFTDVQLELGSVPTAFERLDFGQELYRCQRDYWKTFPYATTPAQSAGLSGAFMVTSYGTGGGGATIRYPRQMRQNPTVLTFNPSAANANWRDVTNAVDRTIFVNQAVSQDSIDLLFSNSGASAAYNYIHAAFATGF